MVAKTVARTLLLSTSLQHHHHHVCIRAEGQRDHERATNIATAITPFQIPWATSIIDSWHATLLYSYYDCSSYYSSSYYLSISLYSYYDCSPTTRTIYLSLYRTVLAIVIAAAVAAVIEGLRLRCVCWQWLLWQHSVPFRLGLDALRGAPIGRSGPSLCGTIPVYVHTIPVGRRARRGGLPESRGCLSRRHEVYRRATAGAAGGTRTRPVVQLTWGGENFGY